MPATRLRDDLGLEGEDLAYVLGEVESEFGITLDARAHTQTTTVGGIIRLVEGELAGFARRARR